MTKYLFFDIDGTIVPFGKEAPESAVQALGRAHERGHKLFLATGRSPAEVDPRLDGIYFDGGVYCGGALAYVGSQEVFSSCFSDDEIKELIEIGSNRGWQMLFQTRSRSLIKRSFMDILTDLCRKSFGGVLTIDNLVEVESYPVRSDVTKICFWTPDSDVVSIRRELADRYDVVDNAMGIPLDSTAEIIVKGQSKAIGMRAVLDYYSAPLSSSISFGDGPNDVELVEEAGFGVAMGNACQAVKDVADYIADDILNDGLSKAMEKLEVC